MKFGINPTLQHLGCLAMGHLSSYFGVKRDLQTISGAYYYDIKGVFIRTSDFLCIELEDLISFFESINNSINDLH